MHPHFIALVLGLSILLCSAVLQADDKAKGEKKDPAKKAEMRKKMAEAHEKMAACLKSDKPMEECKKEMKAMKGQMKHGHHEKCDCHEGGEDHEKEGKGSGDKSEKED